MELFFARQLRTAEKNGFVPAGPNDGLELSTTISGSLGDMAEAPQVGCGKSSLDMMRFQYWFVVLGICSQQQGVIFMPWRGKMSTPEEEHNFDPKFPQLPVLQPDVENGRETRPTNKIF